MGKKTKILVLVVCVLFLVPATILGYFCFKVVSEVSGRIEEGLSIASLPRKALFIMIMAVPLSVFSLKRPTGNILDIKTSRICL